MRTEGRRISHWGSVIAAALIASSSLPAHAEQALASAITQGKPIIDVRARYENVDDDNCVACAGTKAEAGTVRARLGYETGYWNSLSLAFDFDQVWSLGSGQYNSTRNGKTLYPIIADPEITTLNRLQLTYATDFDTKLVLGRQRLIFGNQRFIGNSGWRQHEQTFDGVSLANTSVKDLTLTYTYVTRVNRVFGPKDPAPATGQAGHFNSDSHLINAVYVGIPNIRLEAYGYLLDLRQPGPAPLVALKLSTATAGLRAEGKFNLFDSVSAQLNGEYAHQTDYADNPLSFDLNYWLGEGGLTYKNLSALGGYEVLSGNGAIGFSTPLATLHAFNGWADMFLTTPAAGLTDAYGKLSYIWKDVPLIKAITLTGVYHDFSAEQTNVDFGTEWDASLDFTIDKNASFLVKYAGFDGTGPFKDKTILWAQAGWKL